ncbi:glutathione S-transferase 3-like isoform X2 [Ostrea edulis]|nr:glutathione S-transferase 3-like isoform X2 [Ostrea edulis]XP_048769816.1 glutathione S-transferase 3-like isoform X2 [Ostrea edulis]XP_048778040.1 glutathione S-transferase 3-like isoform X2 [Ostrea edulis]
MAHLVYFNGRGRGEIVRMMLAASEIPFTESFLTERKQFENLLEDGALSFKQVPLLRIDDMELVQTGAIVRYVARKGGLYSADDKMAAMIDMYYDASRDFQYIFLTLKFLKTEEQVIADAKAAGDSKYFPALEKRLKENGTGFLVGNSLTLADVGFLEVLLMCIEYGGEHFFDDYVEVQKYYQRLISIPSMANFLKSPFRKRKNDDQYIAEVKLVLNRT